MSPEEAADVILKADPFDRCISCVGRGTLLALEVHDEVSYDLCKACRGFVVTLRDVYARACEVLEIDLPDPKNHHEALRTRQLAKSASFGSTYGSNPKKIAELFEGITRSSPGWVRPSGIFNAPKIKI